MYAVIRADGRQQRVALGETVRLAKRDAQVGETVQLSEILVLSEGDQTHVGRPLVADASVEAKVVRHGRGKKIRIYKFKRRKGYAKTQGHRQDFTEVRIQRISLAGVDLAPPPASAPEPAPEPEKAPEAQAATPETVATAVAEAPEEQAPAEAGAASEQPASEPGDEPPADNATKEQPTA